MSTQHLNNLESTLVQDCFHIFVSVGLLRMLGFSVWGNFFFSRFAIVSYLYQSNRIGISFSLYIHLFQIESNIKNYRKKSDSRNLLRKLFFRIRLSRRKHCCGRRHTANDKFYVCKNFNNFLSSCSILRIQRLDDKQCGPGCGGS